MRRLTYYLFFLTLFSQTNAQDYSVKNIPENLLKHANAVIRSETCQYNISAVDKIEVKNTETITILNKGGDDFGVVSIVYNPTTRVSDIKVNLLDENGKTIKTYAKKDFSDFSFERSSAIYTDDRILLLKPISTSYPYTIQYSYETNTSDTGFIQSFIPFRHENISLEKSTFEIVNNSGINLRKKVTNTDYASVTTTENGNNLSFSYNNIPAINDEILSPTITKILPEVQFSLDKFTLKGKQGSLANWNDFGKWYYQELLAPVSVVTPEIQAAVNSLNLSGTTFEKVKKLYQYMQNNTRYVNVDIGIGGWQPMEAGEVKKKGYGDCKALTNYMRTLLTAAGINSFYSIVKSDASVEKFDKDFPKLSGNHIILMVPAEKDTIWLENTNQKIAFNHMSFHTADRNVLAVSNKGIDIIETPTFPSNENKELLVAKVAIKEDNSIEGEENSKFTGGQYDRMLRMAYLDNKEQTDFAKELHNSLKFDKVEIKNINNNRDDANITYTMNFAAKDYCKKLGNDIFFRVLPFYDNSALSSTEERLLPFEIPFAFQDDFTVEFSAPVGYKFSELPKPSEISSEYGSYSIDFKLQDGKLLVHRILTIKKGLYPKEKFGSYLDFRKKTTTTDNTKVLITKS